ncbi:hypothetical protein, partial [Streptomyces cadmiisoli]|uniref:hypothetical protein n=1 Tax=Streptomyces cadmiisoli TaxID=2184053 RepID=UPI0036591155
MVLDDKLQMTDIEICQLICEAGGIPNELKELNGKSRILRACGSVRPVSNGRRVGWGQAVRGL